MATPKRKCGGNDPVRAGSSRGSIVVVVIPSPRPR